MEKVKRFLESNNLQHLYDIFKREEINMDILKEMNENDMKEIGIDTKGQRVRLLLGLKTHKENEADDVLDETQDKPDTTHPRTDVSSTERKETHTVSISHPQTSPTERKDSKTASVEVTSLLNKIMEFKNKSKEILSKIYMNIQDLFEENDIFKELRNEIELKFGNVPQTISEHLKDLQEDECPIIITGETSAGKSSFINLLLGVDILPQSSLSCTSTICRIYNKQHKAIFVTDDSDGKMKMKDFCGQNEDNETLKEFLKWNVSLTKLDECGQPTKVYKYVDIHWPIKSLPEGIVLVDTPGIDPDNPDLTKRLLDYLPKALAFIYILNTPNDGGVQSDRILTIRDELGKHAQTGHYFDPKRAIFVCNKWDQIYEEPEEVYESIRSKLALAWQGFDENKLFRLSTREDQLAIKAGKQISNYLKEVIKSIEDMVPATVEENVHRHLQWQDSFAKRMMSNLSVRIRNTLRTKEEREKLIEKIQQRLLELKRNIIQIRYKVMEKAKENCDNLATNLSEYVQSNSTRTRISSWESSKLPGIDRLDILDDYLQTEIKNRVSEELRDKITKEVEQVTNDVADFLKLEDSNIGMYFKEIDELINDTASTPSVYQGHTNSFKQLLPEYEVDMSLKKVLKMAIYSTLPSYVSFGVSSMVNAITEVVSFVKGNPKTKRNNVGYATKKTGKYIDRLTKEFFYRAFSQNLLTYIDKNTRDYFETIIPMQIKAEEEIIRNMQDDTQTPQQVRKECHVAENVVKPVYGQIKYAQGELFREVFFPDDYVKFLKRDGALIETCTLKYDDQSIQALVTRKAVRLNCNVSWNELAEVCLFRKCQHQNLSIIYGMFMTPSQPEDGFVVFTEMCSSGLAERFLQLEWIRCKRYLNEVLQALAFLHSNGLVYRNLRLENIKIKDENGSTAKLSMTELVPNYDLSGEIKGIPIIVAVEVKNGFCCSFESDMFQFAFVFWECYVKQRAFMDSDKLFFKTYEDLYDNMSKGERPRTENMDSKVSQMLNHCWHVDPKLRPMAKECVGLIF